MKWDPHKGLFNFESSDRLIAPTAGVFGITTDGRLTFGFDTECMDDNPQPDEAIYQTRPLTEAERQEIAEAMIQRWLRWMLSDGFPGPCANEHHEMPVKIPGIQRVICNCR